MVTDPELTVRAPVKELEELLRVRVPMPTLVRENEPEMRLARVNEFAEVESLAVTPPKVPVANVPLLVRKAVEASVRELAKKLKPPRSSVPPLSVIALAAGMALALPSTKVPPFTTVAPV